MKIVQQDGKEINFELFGRNTNYIMKSIEESEYLTLSELVEQAKNNDISNMEMYDIAARLLNLYTSDYISAEDDEEREAKFELCIKLAEGLGRDGLGNILDIHGIISDRLCDCELIDFEEYVKENQNFSIFLSNNQSLADNDYLSTQYIPMKFLDAQAELLDSKFGKKNIETFEKAITERYTAQVSYGNNILTVENIIDEIMENLETFKNKELKVDDFVQIDKIAENTIKNKPNKMR